MSETIKSEAVGEYEVSTIWTDAGGAAPSRSYGSPFSSADFVDETPWPYETMVFQRGSSKGLYHEPFSSQGDALAGHERIAADLRGGKLPLGQGVQGPFGTPSTTPEAWADRSARPNGESPCRE